MCTGLTLPTGHLKPLFRLEPVSRCELSTFQPTLIEDLDTMSSRLKYLWTLIHMYCFIHDCLIKEGRKEGNVLFNDTLNTFLFMDIWRQTFGKRPLRYQEKKHAAATMWAILFFISSKDFFICTIPQATDRIAHSTNFDTPVVEPLAGMRNSSVGPLWGIDPTTHCTMNGRSTTQLLL